MKRPLLFIFGVLFLVIGITLILAWWPHVVNFVKGFSGTVLAVAGLFMIYSVKIK